MKLDLLTDIDYYKQQKKELEGIYRFVTANNEYMENYKKGRKSSCLMYWDASKLYGQEISQKSPVDGVKWRNDKFNFDEIFIKCYDEDNDKGHILEADVKYLKQLHNLHNDFQNTMILKLLLSISMICRMSINKLKSAAIHEKTYYLII